MPPRESANLHNMLAEAASNYADKNKKSTSLPILRTCMSAISNYTGLHAHYK